MTGQNGTGAYQHADPRNLTTPFTYTSTFKLPGYAQLPGPGALSVPMGLSSFSGIATAFEQFAPEHRNSPMPWIARHVTEEVTLSLPKEVRVSAMPMPVKVTSSVGTYESSYSQSGQRITVTRTLEVAPQGVLVMPDQYQALRTMGVSIARDLRAQVLYQ